MKIFLGILFLVFACICMGTAFSLDFEKNLRNKIVIFIFSICAGINLGLSFVNFCSWSDIQKEYPANEYSVKIKTKTFDNRTDTTYVIIKK